MNREQLEEIRKRAGKASKGPWRVVLDDSESASTVWQRCESTFHPEDDSEQLGVYDECCIDGGLHSEPFYREADAEFVAAARTDVPALLDEIDRLNKQLTAARQLLVFVAKAPVPAADPAAIAPTTTTAEGSAEGGTSKDSGSSNVPTEGGAHP